MGSKKITIKITIKIKIKRGVEVIGLNVLETQSQLAYSPGAMNDGAVRVDAPAGCTQPFVCPLSHVRAGTSVRIKQLAASPEVTHRLREMGFCEEQKIRLLAQQANIICQVCNVRLGISAQLAEQILVEPLYSPQGQRAA